MALLDTDVNKEKELKIAESKITAEVAE